MPETRPLRKRRRPDPFLLALEAIRTLQVEIEHLSAEDARLREAISRDQHEIEQTLGKALGYPDLYPVASQVDDGTVGVGDHTAASLAAEAAAEIGRLKACLAGKADHVRMAEKLAELSMSSALLDDVTRLAKERNALVTMCVNKQGPAWIAFTGWRTISGTDWEFSQPKSSPEFGSEAASLAAVLHAVAARREG